jgi:hypothetical protein
MLYKNDNPPINVWISIIFQYRESSGDINKSTFAREREGKRKT